MLPHVVLFLATGVACAPASMNAQFKQAGKAGHGNLGVSATLLETREHVSYHGGRHFPMQSVYKLPIAAATLQRVEQGTLALDQMVTVSEDELVPAQAHSPLRDKHPKGGEFTVEDLLRRAIVDSDGSASDVLLRLLGGTREVRRYLKAHKAKGIHVQHTEAQLVENNHAQYSDWAKPDAMVELLIRLQEGKLLNAENTNRVLGWMKESETGKDRIRAKLPSGTEVADKTGSSGTKDGIAAATNDVALIKLPDGRRFAIAVFLSDSKANATTRNGVIADVAHAVWECWAGETK